MKQLFVSYSRADTAAVDDLVRRFSRLGYQGWVDSELHGGQSWWDEILRRIADCDAFVAIVSRDSLKSVACQRELQWALALGKPVLPVAMDHLVQALPRELAERQIVDWTGPGADAAIELAGALMTLPPASEKPEVLPERPAAPLSYLTDLGEQVSQDAALTRQQQREIVMQLQPGLDSADPEEQQGAQYLLDRFSRRDDLYADVQQILRLLGVLRQDTDQPSPVVPMSLGNRVGEIGIPTPSASGKPSISPPAVKTPETLPPAGGKLLLRLSLARRPLVATLAVMGVLAVAGAVVLSGVLWLGSGTSRYAVTASVNVGAAPVGVAVDPVTHTVYVTNSDDGTVSVIDGSTNTVTATVKVGDGPFGVAVDSKTHTVYVTNSDDGTVSVIDGQTNKVVDTVEVGTRPSGAADVNLGIGFAGTPVTAVSWIAANLGTGSVYVTNFDGGTISKIDQSTHGIVGSPLPVGNHPIALTSEPGTAKLFAVGITLSSDNKITDGTLSVIDAFTEAVIDTVKLGRFPLNVAVDPNTHTIYVSKSDGTVWVIDGSKDTAIVKVGTAPVGVAVDSKTRTVYVTNSDDGTVSVIDGQTNKTIDTVNVGQQPGFLAVDPITHTAYVPNSRDNNVSVIQLRQ